MTSNITDIFNLGIDFVFFLGFVSHGYVRGGERERSNGREKGAMGARKRVTRNGEYPCKKNQEKSAFNQFVFY